jgi:hypothetical protein
MAVFTVNENVTLAFHGGKPKWKRTRTKTIQRPATDFVTPLPYTLDERFFDSFELIGPTNSRVTYIDVGTAVDGEILHSTYDVFHLWGSSTISNEMKSAYNQAYKKLLDKVYQKASMLTFAAERQSTFRMVASRVAQLTRGMKALNKGQFRRFLQTFGIAPKGRHKKVRKTKASDAGKLWLEYWFGWAPSVADLYQALKNWATSTHDDRLVVATAGCKRVQRSYYRDDPWYYNKTWHNATAKQRVRIQMRFDITNEDAHWYASQGLVNPALTLWEITPWSWLIDWFTNVGQVISGFTDWVGLKQKDVWMTRFAKRTDHYTYMEKIGGSWGTVKFKRTQVLMKRENLAKLPSPSLIYRIPNISWTRAATAVSLLLQQFERVPKLARP